jgi:hypothetical protein
VQEYNSAIAVAANHAKAAQFHRGRVFQDGIRHEEVCAATFWHRQR